MTSRPAVLRGVLVLVTTAVAAAGVIPQAIGGGEADADGEQAIPEFNRDPAQARIIADDLERFWRAWDRAADNPDERRSIFQLEYLEAGSPGLQAFSDLRIRDVDQLLAAIDAHPRYYASLRAQMPEVRAVAETVQEFLYELQELLPEAVFPDTYLMIGVPEDLLEIIAHEMIHFQQLELTRAAPPTTLLGLSIHEGAADFVAELLTGRHVNQHLHEWAMPREAELWAEFREVMHEEDHGDGLYSGEIDAGRPADLGYFIGYRIVQAYYENTENRKAAVHDILSMTDPEEFLRTSGYERRVERRNR